MPELSISMRTRSTFFTRKVTEAGVKGYTIYNRMLLPTFFRSIEDDYHHLKTHVQVWDVSCERQIEVVGKDAKELVQLITPRDITKMKEDPCLYIPVVDGSGGMLNDPVLVKLSENRYWVSIADSDLQLWINGVATGKGMDVKVFESDVSPLAIQGPKSEELMTRVFGEEIKKIRFFRFKVFSFEGKDLIIARSGYSKQGGFEIYTNGVEIGETLWDVLFQAGADLEVRAGCPNLIERIEGGLLSYGNDMISEHTPHECELGKFCNEEVMKFCIGGRALQQRAESEFQQRIRGLKISGPAVPSVTSAWEVTFEGSRVGQVTSAAWSPDLNTNVAIGMLDSSCVEPGNRVEVSVLGAKLHAEVCKLPFV